MLAAQLDHAYQPLQEAFIAKHASIHRIIRYNFRDIGNPSLYEELVAEATALTWYLALRAYARGKHVLEKPTAVARWASLHVRHGRRLAGIRSKHIDIQRARELRLISAQILSCDVRDLRSDDRNPDEIADRHHNPQEEVDARLDMETWLLRLSTKEQKLVEGYLAGKTGSELGGICGGKSRQAPNKMRRKLYEEWKDYDRVTCDVNAG